MDAWDWYEALCIIVVAQYFYIFFSRVRLGWVLVTTSGFGDLERLGINSSGVSAHFVRGSLFGIRFDT